MDKKRLAINMAAQLLAFAVNMGISFFLAPIIEGQIANTYGFIDLANKFVLYAQIVVSALNTMASRFVTIHIHRGEKRKANEYFSSVFYGNVMMAGIFLAPALALVLFMGHMPFLHVPEGLLLDVQLLWAFVFGNFFLSILTSVYGVSTYAMNRLDLTSIRTMYADILRIVFLFAAFTAWGRPCGPWGRHRWSAPPILHSGTAVSLNGSCQTSISAGAASGGRRCGSWSLWVPGTRSRGLGRCCWTAWTSFCPAR